MTTPRPRPDVFMIADKERSAESEEEVHIDPPRLSVIVPTYCEAENIDPMIAVLDAALAGIRWEVIFVDDDSPDGTADLVRTRGEHDGRVRAIREAREQAVGQHGLERVARAGGGL